jgi:hypothetical protein
MHVASKRILPIVTASLAAVALAASPALAGENDDEGDDDESAPITNSGSSSTSGSSSGVSGAPVGGVDTGAGGMAEQGPDAVLLGLASGALVLVATGGGLVAAARRGS